MIILVISVIFYPLHFVHYHLLSNITLLRTEMLPPLVPSHHSCLTSLTLYDQCYYRLGQPEAAQAVHDAEVHHLGDAAVARPHELRWQPEHRGRRGRVDVLVRQEGLYQPRVPGQLGQHPQLHLGVVGRHQAAVTLCHDLITHSSPPSPGLCEHDLSRPQIGQYHSSSSGSRRGPFSM